MTRIARWNLAVALGILLATGAYAVQPAYIGPMGNLEEPAVRPYKWVFRGLKALAFQTVDALDRGNRKTPGLGVAEGFRGVRKGTAELGESCFKGLTFSAPPRAGDYKKTGTVNKVIDDDLLLCNVCDCGFATQILDQYPVVDPVEQERLAEKAQIERAARAKAAAATRPPTRKEAQAAYIGDRIPQGRKDPYKGNILKLVR